jgi:hypothetical protein
VTEALTGPADGLPRFKLKFRLAGPPLSSIPPTGSNIYVVNIIKRKQVAKWTGVRLKHS